MSIFKNIFNSKKNTIASPVDKVPDPFAKQAQPMNQGPSKARSNSKYVVLEKRVKEGSFEDRLNVLDELKGDRDAKAMEILEWIMYNGNSHRGDVTRFDERAIAAGILGKTGGEQALRAFEGALSVPGLETEVKYAIMEIKKHQDIETLLQGLKNAPVATLAILIEKKDGAGAEKAVELLGSPDIATAVYAARYLGVIQHQAAVDKLITMLQSEYIDHQHSAAVALGRIGGSKAKLALLNTLQHKSEWAKSGAVKGLAFMWANGESDVKEKTVGFTKYRSNICSKDDDAEKNAQHAAVNKMLAGGEQGDGSLVK